MDNKEIVEELKLLKCKIDHDCKAYAKGAVDNLIKKLEAKPVYTKKMQEAGEYPPVEAMVLCKTGHNHLSEFKVSGVSKGSVSGVDIMLSCFEMSMMVKLDAIKPIQTQEEKDIERLKSHIIDSIPFDDKPLNCELLAKELLKHVTLKEGK